jgi:UDP-N-acetylglucosamine 3-dehydrogenase
MKDHRFIRAGLVGCGAIALKGLIPGWMPKGHPNRPTPPPFLEFGGSTGLTIAAACDVIPAQLQEVSRILPGVRLFSEWREMLAAESDLDAVIIAAPNHLHETMVLAALENGLHVFVEKPATTTLEGINRICESVALHQKVVMVHLPWRFSPVARCLFSAMQRNLIGDVVTAKGVFRHAGPQTWSPNADWYFGKLNSEGCLLDLGPHLLDLLMTAIGEPASNILCQSDAKPVCHKAVCRVMFGKNIQAEITLGWDSAQPIFQLLVLGTRGALHANFVGALKGVYCNPQYRPKGSCELESLILTTADNNFWTPIQLDEQLFETNPFAHFTHCVRSGQQSVTSVEAVSEVHRLLFKASLHRSRL